MIPVTAKGATAVSDGAATTTLSVTAEAGDVLVVGFAHLATATLQTLRFGATDFVIAGQSISANMLLEAYYLRVAADAAASLTATLDNVAESPRALIAVAVKNLLPSPYYAQGALNNGTGTTVTGTVLAGVPSYTDSMFSAFVATFGPVADTAGTFGGDFVAGQRAGTTGGAAGNITLSHGFLIVSDATQLGFTKTGITSREWCSTLSRFLGVPDGGPSTGSVTQSENIVEPSHSEVLNLTPPEYWQKHISKWRRGK